MASYIARRKFLATLLGGAAIAWPLAALAQSPTMPVIGVLSTRAAGADPRVVTAFHGGLKEAGFIEGQNLRIEYRFAADQYDRLPMLAADLVRQGVALITTMGTPAAPAAKAATELHMPLYWLVYRHNNQISVVIEPAAARGWPVQRTSMSR